MASVQEKALGGISSFEKLKTAYSIRYETGEYASLSILNNHVFRYYMSPTGNFLDYPNPVNDAETGKINSKTVEDYGQEAFDNSVLENTESHYVVQTKKLKIQFSKLNGTFLVYDMRREVEVLTELKPIHYSDSRCRQILKQNHDEYFFGCGMQNGMYTHKGEKILIDYGYQWDDGSNLPKPFYWSTKGYGVMRNTWKVGCYDFGAKDHQIIETNHNEDYFDAFYFINSVPVDILNDYYELTGSPIFMPEYAFYGAYVNTFNKVYWHRSGGIDGYRSRHYGDNEYDFYDPYFDKTINGKEGILGSLNGDVGYQFSARYAIDWYKSQDMPLGWIVPNNESGYGQTDSFVGDLENLKKFVEYANANGVEVALWSERCVEPNDSDNPEKGERDLSKEIDIGVVALKCDDEISTYELSVIENDSKIFVDKSQNKIRPFIIVRGGWAGIQRCAGVWIGEQTGAVWEYIRLHIPTLIGAGLSGLPVVGSIVEGVYGGGDVEVNTREFQWKVFTPLQINIEGWGRTTKMPFSYNHLENIKLNQASLKLKSMLLPYNYTICHESIHGLPMIRAMFLEFPDEKPSYTKDSQYQYMWGPSLLIAPVYESNICSIPYYVNISCLYYDGFDLCHRPLEFDKTTLRDGVYLPDPRQVWIDLFTGDRYQGGKIYNNIKAPLWKIPVFVKDGAIIPLVNANNNPQEIKRDCRIFLIYPNGATSFKVYEDDGKSTEYMEDEYAETMINVNGPVSNESGNVSICISKTMGNYKDLVEERSTILQIMTSKNVENVKVYVGEIEFDVEEVDSKEEFENCVNVYYYDEEFVVNSYLKVFGAELFQTCLCIKIDKTDVTENEIKIEIENFTNFGSVFGSSSSVIYDIENPEFLTSTDKDTTATTITLHWKEIEASYYEIERDGTTIFSNIVGHKVTFKDFAHESQHSFRIRSVCDAGISQWSDSIEVETKEESSYADIVEDVKVSCSFPAEYELYESNFTKPGRNFWLTDQEWNLKYDDQEPMEKISLSFDLNDVHEIRKVEYLPRVNAGYGTFLKIQYRYSIDRENWTAMSPVISWNCDDTVKVLEMDNGVKFQYFELDVIDTSMGFGSGRSILFYKKESKR